MPDKSFNYQEKTAKLETMIASLESGELDIDEALKIYTNAQQLIQELEDYLKTAENKITKLKTK
jgi:exodeoxyribonuclease VII small subunit